jgi:hypothetical protein
LLTVAVLPEADSNTLDDHALFDIPIMKLGEWMEGDLSDDAVEEWLLRPPAVEPVPETGDDAGEARSGRRRRRRRGGGGGDRQGSEEVVGSSQARSDSDDDFPVSVTFRKRE